jgi:hypothetical protein
MRSLKYSKILVLILILAGILFQSPAQAITVTVDPVTQNITQGNQAIVGILIYGYAPGNVNLAIGSYDFNINYDPAILGFKSLVFGSSLGNPTNSTTSYLNDSVSGILNISEASTLSPIELYALQGQQWPNDLFIAAILTFDTLGVGVSQLYVATNSLLTETGGYFDNYYSDPGYVTVEPVPEPGTMALLGLGMAGLAIYGKRRQKKA